MLGKDKKERKAKRTRKTPLPQKRDHKRKREWVDGEALNEAPGGAVLESAGSYAHDPRVEERTHTSQKPEAKVGAAPGVLVHSLGILGRLVWLSKRAAVSHDEHTIALVFQQLL